MFHMVADLLYWVRSDFTVHSTIRFSCFRHVFCFLWKGVLNICVWRRNGDVLGHMGAYGCATHACVQMHMDARNTYSVAKDSHPTVTQ